jgi:hypothetical protein
MQQRFAHRTLLNIGVELHRNGKKLGLYRTRDIDANAVFIQAADTGLNRNDMVDVDFLIEDGGWRRLRRKGIVGRIGSDGFAVVFVSEDTVFYQTLEELLCGVAATQMAAATDEAFNDQVA